MSEQSLAEILFDDKSFLVAFLVDLGHTKEDAERHVKQALENEITDNRMERKSA